MENKYIYKTKFVKTPEQYIAAVNKGYCVIDYPKEIKEPLLKALKKAMKDSLDLQCAYLIVKTDGRASKMGLKRNFLAVNKLAEQGNLKAINCTGVVYSHYYDDRAYFRYKKAADAGFAIAKCNLAAYYEEHEGYELYIENNAHVKLYLEAANAGYARAQYIYGARFAENAEAQLHYLSAAAKQKYAKAYVKLGEIVPYIDKQLYWFKKALKEGYTEVYDSIASIYAQKGDSKKAVFYYTKSMRSGNEISAYILISTYPNLISKKVRKETETAIHEHERKFKRVTKKILSGDKKEEEEDDSFIKFVHDALNTCNDDERAYLEEIMHKKEKYILDKSEELGAIQKIFFLDMSSDIMNEIILASYKENDEEGTFARIAERLKDLENKQSNKFERFIFEDLKIKFDNLTYSDIADNYEVLIAKKED